MGSRKLQWWSAAAAGRVMAGYRGCMGRDDRGWGCSYTWMLIDRRGKFVAIERSQSISQKEKRAVCGWRTLPRASTHMDSHKSKYVETTHAHTVHI